MGKHKIEIKPKAYDNFAAYNEIIDFNGAMATLDIKLEPRDLKISFESDMTNTYLYVDNKLITNILGNTKCSSIFTPGEHELAFRREGKNEIKKIVIFSSSQNSFLVSFKDREIYIREEKGLFDNIFIPKK